MTTHAAPTAPSPWSNWRSHRRKTKSTLEDHPEDTDPQRPLLDITSPLSLSEPTPTQSYGSTHGGEGSGPKGSLISPTRVESLLSVPEEGESGGDEPNSSVEEDEDEDDDEDWELERQGLYRGSYARLVTLYTLVPLSSLLSFVLLALLPIAAYRDHVPDTYPYPTYFPFPLPEVLASASLWSLSHLIRIPLHTFFTSLAPGTLAIVFSTFFHVILHNLLRLAALPILLVRHHMHHAYPTWHDPSFRRVWWIALGWSFAKITVGVAQGYEQIALYRDVLIPEGNDEEFLRRWHQCGPAGFTVFPSEEPGQVTDSPITKRDYAKGKNAGQAENNGNPEARSNGESGRLSQDQFRLDSAIRSQVDRDLDHLMAFKGREELEEVYGIPAIRIPVFVSCLLRLDSIILSLGLTLLLSASYLCSSISLSDSAIAHSSRATGFESQVTSNRSFYITFPIVIVLHFFLSFLHTPLVLPRIGIHTAAYVGLLVSLGCFFAGLGMWEALS